ncbi:hypothetical protein DSECCO2_631020 [anaerobic digester metagenome]
MYAVALDVDDMGVGVHRRVGYDDRSGAVKTDAGQRHRRVDVDVAGIKCAGFAGAAFADDGTLGVVASQALGALGRHNRNVGQQRVAVRNAVNAEDGTMRQIDFASVFFCQLSGVALKRFVRKSRHRESHHVAVLDDAIEVRFEHAGGGAFHHQIGFRQQRLILLGHNRERPAFG